MLSFLLIHSNYFGTMLLLFNPKRNLPQLIYVFPLQGVCFYIIMGLFMKFIILNYFICMIDSTIRIYKATTENSDVNGKLNRVLDIFFMSKFCFIKDTFHTNAFYGIQLH